MSIIFDMINKNNKISAIQLAEKLNITRRTVHRDLEKLKAISLIEHIGADKGGYWKIIEK